MNLTPTELRKLGLPLALALALFAAGAALVWWMNGELARSGPSFLRICPTTHS